MEKLPVPQQEKLDIPIVDGELVPSSFNQLWRLSCVIADSKMINPVYEKRPEAVMVASQFGAQLGMKVMASLQNITVINGQPALWGDSMPGIVIKSKTLEMFIEYFDGEYDKDDFMAVCIAKRIGMGSEYVPEDPLDLMQRKGLFVNTFSIADAKRAGLWGGTGKEEWQKKASAWYKYPKRMLKMRARGLTLRDGWPDVLKGMHAKEELQGDFEDLRQNAKGQYEIEDGKIDLSAGVSLYGEKPVKKEPKPKKEDTDKEIQSKFDKMLDDIEYDEISLADYMNYVCDRACVSSIEVMKSAIVDFKAFYNQYRAWISREVEPAKDDDIVDATFDNPPEKPETEPEPAGARNPLVHNGPPAGVRLDGLPKWGEDHPWWRDNWIKMKTAGYKGFVEDNRKALDSAPEPIQTEAKGKYLALYKEPMDTEKTPKEEEEGNQEEENKTWEKDISDSGPAPSPRERLINEMSLKGIKDQDVISDVDLYVKEYSEAAGQTKNEIILEILGDLTKFLKRFVTWRSLMKKTDLSGASQETVDEEIEKKQTMVSSRGILVEAGIALKRQNPELWSKACEALGFAPLPVANLEDEELDKIIKMVKKDADSPF
jgi:hypothetical protein